MTDLTLSAFSNGKKIVLNEFVLYHHLGLGDHFICNGLVNYLTQGLKRLFLPCKEEYLKTVSALYADNPKVKIFTVKNEPDDVLNFNKNIYVVVTGFVDVSPSNFERTFYEQFDLPYEIRFWNFSLPKKIPESKNFLDGVKKRLGDDFIFVHDESTVGKYDLLIKSSLPRYTVNKNDTSNLLDYVDTLKEAKEIHLINSSISALVINMYQCNMLTYPKIYYHDVRTVSQGGLPLEIPSKFIKVNY